MPPEVTPPVVPPTQTPTVDPLQQKFSITVDGQKQELPLSDLLKMAEKAGGADRRFQEAAQMRQQLGEAAEIRDLLTKAETDDEAFRKLGKMMGRSDEDVEAILSARQAARGDGKAEPEPKPAMSPQQQKMLDDAHQEAMRTARERAQREMRDLLDKDEQIGTKVIEDPKVREKMARHFEGLVVGRLAKGEPWSPALLSGVLTEVRELFESVRGTSKPTGPAPTDPVEMLRSLGVSLGPSSSKLVEAVQAGKPIERVPVTDPNYIANLTARGLLASKQGQ